MRTTNMTQCHERRSYQAPLTETILLHTTHALLIVSGGGDGYHIPDGGEGGGEYTD